MVGNYGVPDRSLRDEFGLAKHFESDQIHASALLVQVRETARGLDAWRVACLLLLTSVLAFCFGGYRYMEMEHTLHQWLPAPRADAGVAYLE